MNDQIVVTHDLTKKYKKHTSVDGLNLRIRRGEIYGFLGPNGAGKTTTIRMLLGLIKPTKGNIEIFGQNLNKNRLQILQRIGSLVESPTYYGNLTAYENLEAVRRLRGLPEQRVNEVLETVRLSKVANRLTKEYSLGMKQRLGIAVALLSSPDLLILDEPTNGLDPSGIQEIRELIKELPKSGMSVIVSSHLLSEIDQMATQVGIINNGRMIFQDSIASLHQKRKPLLKVGVSDVIEAKTILNRKGLKVDLQKNYLWLSQTEPEFVSEINSILLHSGLSVFRLEEKTRSLEDIFLELTGTEGSL
ncbi:ABC transporter ATP-binding protein [Bacillus velezensis]|uniref:ABC transporter ATP-binding protein n=1 Tax=Bacillus velezensis (strain DSM 23117 / BGSC 10A6 / LMG 26770 / FZB42) TaxID=326423 RepID=A7ZAG9_BACVZ|nr:MULTISPECIES: ABC transporter ATP-binding protein [Bacillus amyloliquefaciens group]ABS75995.1 ABC transporter ATP-binding protein [Bacillus velezensis FZB42]AGZ58521.1 mrsF [Bacillus amyloliquefaciens CC178]KUP40540.1 bacitracin ABC transporter ATP-binding protein [Bacillus velezensis]MBG9698744.1 bacitracin ABC transporter ATP-binding protein [Bacillus amyloliquefaciens]MBT9269736.1 ABC transporter ATP-binding protein [Bacillus velezensis]